MNSQPAEIISAVLRYVFFRLQRGIHWASSLRGQWGGQACLGIPRGADSRTSPSDRCGKRPPGGEVGNIPTTTHACFSLGLVLHVSPFYVSIGILDHCTLHRVQLARHRGNFYRFGDKFFFLGRKGVVREEKNMVLMANSIFWPHQFWAKKITISSRLHRIIPSSFSTYSYHLHAMLNTTPALGINSKKEENANTNAF